MKIICRIVKYSASPYINAYRTGCESHLAVDRETLHLSLLPTTRWLRDHLENVWLIDRLEESIM